LEPARAMPHVRDVRVKGAIGVVELDRIDDIGALRHRFIAAGVFVRPIRNIVYLTPAFTIGEEDLHHLTGAVISVLEQWTRL
ncbi:MAG: aminotransferase class III-fold pyridoxal phosphate-dependent enzyme, partial [Methylocella sp.]